MASHATIVDRRGFLGGAAVATGALVIPIMLDSDPADAAIVALQPGALPASGKLVGPYIKIDTQNLVTVVVGPTEMGQGIMSGLAQLVAAELMLDWNQIRAEHSVTTGGNAANFANPLFGAQVTGGSTSMRGWYGPTRQAAAQARALLLQAAAQTFGSSWQLAHGGKVVQGATVKPFSALVVAAAALPNPGPQALLDPEGVIGKSLHRLDIPAKVDGSAIYGIDRVLPNMVYATSVHCPTLTGTVATMPAAPSGVTLVNLGTAVGVVAGNTWAAMHAANSIAGRVGWTLPTNTALLDSTQIASAGSALLLSNSAAAQVQDSAGNALAALNAAAKVVDATYSLPFLAHGYMEVINCTVAPTYGATGALTKIDLWVPTQAQAFVLPNVAALTGLATSQINIHTPYIGGGFGRKIEQDYVTEAVKIALAMRAPAKLTWSRPQDFTNDKYRPSAQIRVLMGADAYGGMSSLFYRNVSPSIGGQRNPNNPEDTGALAGAVGMAYAIPNRHVEYVPNPCDIPLGYWRSVGESYNSFAVESAIDELAAATGQNPLAFRQRLLAGDPRALAVVNAVATLANWGRPGRGAAQGLAFLKGFGSYIAVVAEVTASSSKPKVTKLSVAIDCGTVVNPDSVTAQLQGGLVHGLSAALWQQALFNKGVPATQNYNSYRVARLQDVPAIATTIVPSTAAPGGVGETGVPCVAPAICNAWAALTGQRLRALPLFPGSTMSDG